MVGRTELTERGVRLAGEAFAKGPHKAGFADAGLTEQEHDLALALPGPPPMVEQERKLMLAADQRSEPGRVHGREPVLGCALAQDLVNRDRLGESLEARRPRSR